MEFLFCNKVGPQAIFVVGRDDDDDSIAAGSEVSDDAASWETVDDDEMDAVENGQEVCFYFTNSSMGVPKFSKISVARGVTVVCTWQDKI